MSVLNLYTKFSIPVMFKEATYAWTEGWLELQQVNALKSWLWQKKPKKLLLSLLCKVLFPLFFLNRTWEAILHMNEHELILLPFNKKYTRCPLQQKPKKLFPDVFNHATGNAYNYRQNKYNHGYDSIKRCLCLN